MAKRTQKRTVEPPADAAPPLRLEWRSPAELAENPANWRRHRQSQLAALTDVIAEVGWAGACLYNERTGRLIDGHARRKVALDQGAEQVPVLVGNWTEDQEKKILATLDPLAAMANADKDQLEALLREVQTDSQAVNDMLADLAKAAGVASTAEETTNDGEEALPEKFQVLVDCNSEQLQRELLERFATEGLTCRSLIY